MRKIFKMAVALVLSVSMLVSPTVTEAALTTKNFSAYSGDYYYYARCELVSKVLCSKKVSNAVELDKENRDKNDTRTYTTVSIGKNVTNTISGTASVKISLNSIVKSMEGTFGVTTSNADTTTEAYVFYVYKNEKIGYYYVKENLYGYEYACTQAYRINKYDGTKRI